MSLCCQLFLYASQNENLGWCSYTHVPLGVSTYNTIEHDCQTAPSSCTHLPL